MQTFITSDNKANQLKSALILSLSVANSYLRKHVYCCTLNSFFSERVTAHMMETAHMHTLGLTVEVRGGCAKLMTKRVVSTGPSVSNMGGKNGGLCRLSVLNFRLASRYANMKRQEPPKDSG